MPVRESELIRAIRKRVSHKGNQVRVGLGADCAVIRPKRGEELVVTTDFSIEDVHFRRDWHPPESVGHRCLARGLSDIAAMGARPVAAFLSLALLRGIEPTWLDRFFDGFLALAKRYDCVLAGGDTSESPNGVIADVMVIGSVPQGRALLRSTAKPGDVIYVSGALGASAADLKTVSSRAKSAVAGRVEAPFVPNRSRHFSPEPRVELGAFLCRKKLARAMIDVSDGLSTDLAHICEESGVGAILNRDLIPMAPGADLDLALHGGEDYELLFTAPERAKVPVEYRGVPITEIGWITRGRETEGSIMITDLRSKPQLLPIKGWQHFER